MTLQEAANRTSLALMIYLTREFIAPNLPLRKIYTFFPRGAHS